MTTSREAREGTQPQGTEERIAYRLDVSNWGEAPTAVLATVTDRSGNDVTSVVMVGQSQVNKNVITLPVLHSLTAGMLYRVDVLFTIDGNELEAYFYVRAEA